MIDFLVNLALTLSPKTLQNSSQDASKIDQKSIPTSIKMMIEILSDFLAYLAQYRANITPKPPWRPDLSVPFFTFSGILARFWGQDASQTQQR